MKIKIDFHSIRFRLWCYFIGFSIILLVLVWLLQIFFLDTYYEAMKMQETKRISDQLINEFRTTPDMYRLNQKINRLTANNDVYIRVETGNGNILAAPDYEGRGRQYLYAMQAEDLRNKLLSSQFKNISTITPGANDTRTLSYACYLYKATDGTEEQNRANSYILYLFSPLYPVKSTISILRTQLIYITIISILLAISLSLYLANHISKPIKKITRQAAEMGKGNYGIRFNRADDSFTEISELADTLTKASRELEKTDMYQKDLIANVSHDLKTPLTMIKSYAEMIRDLSGDNPKKRNEHLNVIIDEADRLNILVNDMLNLSRMQSGQIVLENSYFNITATLESLLASYDILSEQEGYKFIYKKAPSFYVYGDEAKIKQVISNLVSNAVKYCGKDKQVIITLKKSGISGRKVRCEVTDHGEGIAEDEINHVWERYYKSSTHHVRPTEGTGLGLSIVKEILTLHKADFGVDSKPGKGSTFWFEMNIAKPKQDNK